jgi:hypothetical protein
VALATGRHCLSFCFDSYCFRCCSSRLLDRFPFSSSSRRNHYVPVSFIGGDAGSRTQVRNAFNPDQHLSVFIYKSPFFFLLIFYFWVSQNSAGRILNLLLSSESLSGFPRFSDNIRPDLTQVANLSRDLIACVIPQRITT